MESCTKTLQTTQTERGSEHGIANFFRGALGIDTGPQTYGLNLRCISRHLWMVVISPSALYCELLHSVKEIWVESYTKLL